MVWWLFRSGKSLLHSAAEKAYHAEIAFRDASRAMHGSKDALIKLRNDLGSDVPKPLASNVHYTMRRVERHARILRRHTIEMRKHMEALEKEASRARRQ